MKGVSIVTQQMPVVRNLPDLPGCLLTPPPSFPGLNCSERKQLIVSVCVCVCVHVCVCTRVIFSLESAASVTTAHYQHRVHFSSSYSRARREEVKQKERRGKCNHSTLPTQLNS